MLEGLRRLRKQEKFTGERTWEENRKIYMRRADLLFRFQDDHLIATFGDNEVPRNTIFALMRLYCQKNKLRFISKSEITKRLPRYIPSINETRPSIN